MVIASAGFTAQAPASLELNFAASAASLQPAVEEYRAIWSEDGPRIVAAMERATGLRFEAGPIEVGVYEGTSLSGIRAATPMRMRASYSMATKRATLVHELGHRLIGDLVPDTFDDHPAIFLFVYDVWVELWGTPFADEQVAVERKRTGPANYDSIWTATLALTTAERAGRFRQFVAERRK
jgi:hypothetical protein